MVNVESKGSIRLNVVGETRPPIRDDLESLVRVLDEREQQVATDLDFEMAGTSKADRRTLLTDYLQETGANCAARLVSSVRLLQIC